MARACDAGLRISGIRRAQSVDVGDEIRLSDESAATDTDGSEGASSEKAFYLSTANRESVGDLVQVVE